ncbi:MAG: ABC transporter substrate-binding protein [Candidatus Hodarchaeota archaeon]
MLVTTSLGSFIRIAQAETYYFTLHAVLIYPPPFYCLSLFQEIISVIDVELAKIGIELVVEYYDDYEWRDVVWDMGWNHTGGTPFPPGGWDVTLTEWWMMPTGLFQVEPLMYSWLTPPEGYNIFPWMDERADSLLWYGMHTLEAEERRTYLWRWQEEFMHNPPMANLYYPRMYEITADWVEGWDAVVRFRDISHLAINETMFAQYAPEWRKTVPNTLIYAVEDEVISFNPLFVETITEQWMFDLTYDTLYDLSIDQWPPTGQEPPPWDFYSKPALAAAPPISMEGPNGPNTRARVLLRDDVYWSDGIRFNATDVKFTFDLVLNPYAKAVAYSDLEPVVESVGIVNETCVDFILHEPYPDLTTLLSNDRGLAIIPWHILGDIPPCQLRHHPSTFDWTQMLPGTGPFIVTDFVQDSNITLERNPEYFGYDLDWGPYNVTEIILQWIPDWAQRMADMMSGDIDFGEYTPAPVQQFTDLQEWPNLRVWEYDSPSSTLLFFNLDNQYLSNRYVRQAVCHAIPYDNIIKQILPMWGIATAYRGKTLITPLHYYTDESNVTVHLFNDDLEPYEYNIVKAQEYLNMWLYSQPLYAPEGSAEVLQGPVGDADFSGRVDYDDFWVWWKNYGDDSPWEFLPGQDIDPDFNNDGSVTMVDYNNWTMNYYKEYPFAGAR